MLHTRFQAVPPRLDCGFLLELQFNLPEVPPQNLKRCPQNPKSNLDKCGETACPTELHRQFALLVGQVFSLSALLPRTARQGKENVVPN